VVSDHDLDASEAWVDAWQASFQERADQARVLRGSWKRSRVRVGTVAGW
jgi:hypothetical protein